MESEKIYLVTQESCVDGYIIFETTPCANKETAMRILEEEVRTLLNESHFRKYIDHRPDDFILEEDETHYYIEDLYADYYEDIRIEEKEIQF